MTKLFQRGLVVGKFSPLHSGHELTIQTAIEQCEDVVVISYSKPEYRGCDRERRERWLRALFPRIQLLVLDDESLASICDSRGLPSRCIPSNTADDNDHRCFVGWLCISVLGTTIDAVFTSEAYGDGFAQVLTREFRDSGHSGKAVRHISVDLTRTKVPISGSQIRTDVHAFRRFLSPAVYASFVTRVCFIGGESTGKTTLARDLATKYGTRWVPEYGRELWELRQGQLVFEDMLQIARTQIEREKNLAEQANHWLFCDTSPLTTLFYSQAMFGRVDAELVQLAERRYDVVVLCAPDFDFVQDGTRQGESFRGRQHDWYLRELRERNIQCIVAHGFPAHRESLITSFLASRLGRSVNAQEGVA